MTRKEPKPSTREISEAGERKVAAAELDRLIEETIVDWDNESEDDRLLHHD
jgi:hypothetical protein